MVKRDETVKRGRNSNGKVHTSPVYGEGKQKHLGKGEAVPPLAFQI